MIDRLVAGFLRVALGVRRRDDLPAPTGPRVYVANHTSHLDFLMIWAALPDEQRRRTRPVAAADYWTRGRLRTWLSRRVFRAILIDRGKINRDADPIADMAEHLGPEQSLILFPEGARSLGAGIGAFKPGIYRLATVVSQVELVPVGLENLGRILPKGAVLPVPLLGGVHFGPPVPPPQPGESRSAFLERLRGAVVDLVRFQPADA